MLLMFFLQLLVGAFLTEALTQLIVKSDLFGPLRKLCKGVPFLGKVLNCGYCASFWVAGLFYALGLARISLAYPPALNMLLWVLLLQRTSNVMHNCIDKFTDKYYSLAHTNSDKGEE